jgi:hypothetical protein
VTFNLQTLEEATGLAEMLARQLKEGELHLRLASKARLVIDVPQSGADPCHAHPKEPPTVPE